MLLLEEEQPSNMLDTYRVSLHVIPKCLSRQKFSTFNLTSPKNARINLLVLRFFDKLKSKFIKLCQLLHSAMTCKQTQVKWKNVVY